MKKKLKKIPRYSNGVAWADMNNSARANHLIGAGTSFVSNAFADAPDGPSVGGVLGGAAQGAAAGAPLGPWGIAGGAVLGALTSPGMWNSGATDGQGNIVEKPGLFGHSMGYLKQKAGRERNGVIAREMSQQMNADWYMNNGYNYLSMANGGITSNVDIFADNGEIVETPGNMPVQLPDTNLPEDSFYMTVPPKTKITSNKLLLDKLEKLKLGLNPNKKYTYADAYRELEKPLSKGADIYAENTNKLNAYANKLTNDIIVDMLETKKLKKGIKPKTKNLAIAAAIGFDDENRRALYQYADSVSKARNEKLYDLPFRTNTESVTAPEGLQPGQTFYHNGDIPYVVNADGTASKYSFLTPIKNAYNRNIQAQYALRRGETLQTTNTNNLTSRANGNYGISPLYFAPNTTDYLNIAKTQLPSDYYDWNSIKSWKDGTWWRRPYLGKSTLTKQTTANNGNKAKVSTGVKIKGTNTIPITNDPIANTPRETNYGPGGKLSDKPNLKVKASYKLNPKYTERRSVPVEVPEHMKPKSNINWADTLYGLSSVLTPLLDRPKSEKVNAYVPHAIMGPTEYNIDPILTEAALTNSINRYNQANINPNTGANMALGLQSGVQRNRAIANAYNVKNNAENQMAMQNAGIYNNWSRDFANARHVASVEQAQNDAAARNIARTGRANALQNWGQILRDSKANRMNAAKLQSIMPLLKDTMPTADYNELIKLIA